MTVYKPKGRTCYRYDFKFHGQRYAASTGLTTLREAEIFEGRLKQKLRERAAGVAVDDPSDSPRFQEWAEVYLATARKDMEHPERVEHLLRVALRFWGARPTKSADVLPGEPYHDLRLGEVLADPYWIVRFDEWLETRRVPYGPHPQNGGERATRPMAGHTKNQYRSVVSQMFDLAAAPAYRQRTGVLTNPFRGAARDRGRRRTVALSIPEIQEWLSHCSRHVGLAMTIAALAPKLRVSNILQLRWMNIDPELTTIIVKRHKTAHRTNRPLVVTISQPLRRLLQVIRQQQVDGSQHVITYRGGPVASIRDGVRMAAIRAGIAYGRDTDDGATFHTIRHSLATMLARLARIDGQRPLSTEERMQLMGHTDAQTTLWYTHLSGEDEIGPSERIGAIMEPFIDVATTLRRRALTRRLPPPPGIS